MITHAAPTKEQVEHFVSNLRESLLKAVEAKEPVFIGIDYDSEPVMDKFGIVSDAVDMGCKYTICVGRPALVEEWATKGGK